MLKIQELHIDGRVFYVREPRVRDYIEAKKAPEDQYTYALMGQMILDEDKNPIGVEALLEMPLAVFDQMNSVVEEVTKSRKNGDGPLTQSDGSSTG